ncbi:acetyltransferase [Novosphingobium sp. CECT 9465]|uniref:acetyltransferase n=1 Tax=Novosphingobium sp. CECT 9465 TaxID=2829794 RepID=UPI001E2A3FDD|nr:acetyltransferase [Novosphingobium sp. CECT 9465]CAH0496607.1 hypothetical protein NVSP9465_01644 [Novosphingobium sp. CECT 9465]
MSDPYDDIIRRKQARPASTFHTFQPEPVPEAANPYDDIIARRRNRQVGAILRAAPAPDAAAQANRIARARGLPAAAVDPKLQAIQIADQATSFINTMGIFPRIGSWAEANPRDAAAAADDTRALGKMGRAFDPVELARGWSISAPEPVDPTFVNSVKGVWSSLVGGWKQMDAGLSLAIDDWVPAPKWLQGGTAYSDRLRSDIVQAQDDVETSTPAFRSETARGIYGGFASVAQMAPGVAASIITRSPVPAMAVAGIQTGGTAYGKYRVRGGTRAESATGALLEGTIEAGFEAIPMAAVVSKFGKGATGKFIGEVLAKEMLSEQATTFAQDAVDTAIANPDKTWGQFIAERPEAAYQTALGVLVAAGTLGGLHAVASKAEQRHTMRAQAEAEGIFLDRLGEGAGESKLRARDPDGFKAMMDHLTESMTGDRVYVPAEKIREFMQSPGFEDSDFWRSLEDDLASAEATGGDVVLPVSSAMTHIAGTPAWDALRNDMRMSAGGVSRSEALALADEQGLMESDLSVLVDASSGQARTRLFSSAFEKLAGAGFSPNTARVQAELVTQRYMSRSDRLGRAVTGTEFDHVGIEQVLPEKLREATKADATDLVINALRRGQPSTVQSGPSLVEWIVQRGGINDLGGDLKAVGLADWHKERPFRRKAIRDFDPAASMGGISGNGDYGHDSTLRAAVEAGFFPELAGQDTGTLDTQILISAISDELAGNARYASDPKVDAMRAASEELGQMLTDAGRDPASMSDGEIRDFIGRYTQGDSSGRSYNSGERGKISFTADGKAVVQLFQSRNLSTFLHESGHLWLEELKADAALPDAPEQLKADWKAVQAWFSANGHKVGKDIPVGAHELWARGFESYLMEGKSPSSALLKVFETMRAWMVGLYRRVQNLKSPISDDVRRVMDRLLATDQEIAEKSEAQGLDPVFADAASGGMTREEFDAYMDLVAQAKSTANSELLAKSLRALKARQTDQYRLWENEARAEVSRSVDARPAFRALEAIRTQPLNRDWVIDRFGADSLKLLPASVPPAYREGGVHPDSLAEALGLRDGRNLVETLMGLEKQRKGLRAAGDKRTVRQATIDAETHDVMAERYGDPFTTGKIEEEALAAVHNDLQGEVIAAEVRALARRTSKRPTPYGMAREWARRRVRSGEVRDHISRAAIQQYRRTAAMNSKAAFEALAAGKVDLAFRHKQAQLLNNALVREARDAAQEIDTAITRLDRVASRKKIAGVDAEYLDQAHELLSQVDFKERTGKAVDRKQSFEAWANAREDEGHTIAVPKSFATMIGKTHWTKLSAEELLGLDDAVKQILHLGRLKQTLLDNQEQRELDALVGEAVKTMERLPLRKVKSFDDPSKWDDIKSGALGIGAALLKMETVFHRLDGSRHGAFNRVVFQPLAKAQADEHKQMREVLDELDGHLGKVPPKILATWNDPLTVASLFDPRTREPMQGPRSRLISMALNMGNEGNASKLAGGYGWREAEVMRVLDAELQSEEWRYVQAVWDTIGKFWPRIVELEKRVNGIEPDAVRPRVLTTSAGVLRGGYFPVVYDPARSRTANEHAAKGEGKLYENGYTRPSTSRGFTKERTEVQRPVLLSLDVINRHVAEVVHDLTHREAVMQAWRFLGDKRLMDAVDETMGPDVSGLFRPWLQFIANEWVYDRAGMSKLESFMRAARRNTTFVGMAYRIGTMISQLGGYAMSVERVGPKWFAAGMNATLRHPRETSAFALERSLELQSRFDTLDRDIRENVRRFAGKTDLASMVQRYAFSGISMFDRIVVIPTWIGAYNKAIAAGMEQDQAVHEADSAVRESQGAGAAKDLAAIQRGRGPAGELGKVLTQFYSFQSASLQRFIELGWDVGDARRSRNKKMIPELAMRGLLIGVISPVLPAILTGNGPDDDNEESWTEWAAKQSVYNLAAPIPLLRDIVPVVGRKLSGDKSFGYRFTPVQGIGESLERVAGDVRKVAQGKETTRATRNTLEAAGYVTGLVPGQGAASAQFLMDVMSGDAAPQDMGDWWEGVRTGRIEDDGG